MHDCSGVGWKGLVTLNVLFGYHLEYSRKFRQCGFLGGHQCVATRNGWYFRDPSVWLIPVKDHLVVIQAHLPQFSVDAS